VKYLIEECHADVSTRDGDGHTRIYTAAVHMHTHIVRYLKAYVKAQVMKIVMEVNMNVLPFYSDVRRIIVKLFVTYSMYNNCHAHTQFMHTYTHTVHAHTHILYKKIHIHTYVHTHTNTHRLISGVVSKESVRVCFCVELLRTRLYPWSCAQTHAHITDTRTCA